MVIAGEEGGNALLGDTGSNREEKTYNLGTSDTVKKGCASEREVGKHEG